MSRNTGALFSLNCGHHSPAVQTAPAPGNEGINCQRRWAKIATLSVFVSGKTTITALSTSAPHGETTEKRALSAYLIAGTIPLVCLVGAWTSPAVPVPLLFKSLSAVIYLSVLLVLWCWLNRHVDSHPVYWSPVRAVFFALFLLGTLSVLWAVNADFWLYKWLSWYGGAVIFFLGLQLAPTEDTYDRVFNCAIAGGLIISLVGIAQYLFGLDTLPQASFPASTFANGNIAGHVIVLIAPLPLYFLFKRDLDTRGAWFYSLALSLILLYAVYTRTRAVWLACVLEIALLGLFIAVDGHKKAGWLHWNGGKSLAAAVSTLLLVLLMNVDANGIRPFWDIAVTELASLGTDISATEGPAMSPRYAIWSLGVEMLQDKPLIGSGLGSFFDNVSNGYVNARISASQRTHNDILELGVELGLVGLAVMAAIVVLMLGRISRLYRSSSGTVRPALCVLVVALTASMLNAQLSFPYQQIGPLVILPLFAALLIRAAEAVAPTGAAGTWHLGRAPVYVLLPAGLLMASVVTVLAFQWQRDLRNVDRHIAENRLDEPFVLTAAAMDPDYISSSRWAYESLVADGHFALAQQVIAPLVDYWPDAVTTHIAMIQSSLGLNRFEEAHAWAVKLQAAQPESSYLAELYLMNIYNRQGDGENLRRLYWEVMQLPEEILASNVNYFKTLLIFSIVLEELGNVPALYGGLTRYYTPDQQVEINMAVYYVNIGDIAGGIPHMKKAFEFGDDFEYADIFRDLIDQNTGAGAGP